LCCIAETQKRLAQLQEVGRQKALAIKRPWKVVKELKNAVKWSQYPASESTLIRLRMTLEPASNHPDETKGLLNLTVSHRANS